jgi:hypothetical protein
MVRGLHSRVAGILSVTAGDPGAADRARPNALGLGTWTLRHSDGLRENWKWIMCGSLCTLVLSNGCSAGGPHFGQDGSAWVPLDGVVGWLGI